MAARLRGLFDEVLGGVLRILEGGPGAEEARARILGQRGGLAAALARLVGLALAVQRIERTALGMDGARHGHNGATEEPGRIGGSAPPLQVTELSTDELAALAKVAAMLDRARGDAGAEERTGADGLPLPPIGPG
jgi:hypothetical protein